MRVTILSVSITLATILILSCGTEPQLKDGDTVFFPDTIAFKQEWKMEEQQMLTEVFAADTSYNQLGLDTIDLTFKFSSGPDWIDTSKLALDCKECSEFYTEPAVYSLMFPTAFLYDGNTVRFYGVRIPGVNVPAGREFSPPSAVFRYYGYDVIGTFKVWGPTMSITQNQDTVEQQVILVFD